MSVFALVDCNNFYASCERIFKPSLNGKPIAVLSNNDGCVIARSNETKQLGIPMGAPFYQYRDFFKQHNVSVFSSNYPLYGDISQRIMSVLRLLCPEVEVYSIDEAFLRLNSFSQRDLCAYAREVRQTIMCWIGMPVSIGIGPSKTLAKIANHLAKRQMCAAVFDLRDKTLQESILTSFAVKDIWGIGSRLSFKLNQLGIYSALELRNYPSKILRKHFGVTVERTALELKGISCLDLEEAKPKKNIIASRSFGQLLTSYEDLAAAVSYHTTRACIKLRQENSQTQGIYTFVSTNPFRENDRQYHNGHLSSLIQPSADTCLLIETAKQNLAQIYRSGYAYQKAGITLMDIVPVSHQQQDLFMGQRGTEKLKRQQLMQVVDSLNEQMGSNTVFFAAQGTNNNWMTRAEHKSFRYTSNWAELAQAQS